MRIRSPAVVCGPIRAIRRAGSGGRWGKRAANLVLTQAAAHNLKNLTVSFPLNRLVVVTGVSGSGKSTLVRECLIPALQAKLGKSKRAAPLPHGCESGRLMSRSRPSTKWTSRRSAVLPGPRPQPMWAFSTTIRQLFAQTPEARLRGLFAGPILVQ